MSDPNSPKTAEWVNVQEIMPGVFPCKPIQEKLDAEKHGAPPREHKEVLFLDLRQWSLKPNSVENALRWVEGYYRELNLHNVDVPACLVVFGEDVEPRDHERLVTAGAHYIDLGREEIKQQMGRGPERHHELVRLIQNIYGLSLPPDVNPYDFQPTDQSMAISSVSSAGVSQPSARTNDWDQYTRQPAHIPPTVVTELFRELARDDVPWWERDS